MTESSGLGNWGERKREMEVATVAEGGQSYLQGLLQQLAVHPGTEANVRALRIRKLSAPASCSFLS